MILFIEWLALYFIGAGKMSGTVVSVSWLVFTVYQIVIAYRYNNMAMLIFFFFMLSYSYEPIRYFVYSENMIRFVTYCESDKTVYDVAIYSYLFCLVMCYFIRYQRKDYIPYRLQLQSNTVVWLVCLIFGVIMLAFGKTGQNIFESGGYSQTLQSADASSMYAYATIPLLIGLVYSNNRTRRIITFGVMAVYILKDLAFGGRIDSIILIIASYIIYFRHVMSRKLTLICIYAGLVLNLVWGAYRLSVNSSDLMELTSEAATNVSVGTGNSAFVYFASMRILYMIQGGILTLQDRIQSFVEFLLSVVVPYKYLSPLANLAFYNQTNYYSGGGGLFPIFIYTWLGLVGVIVSGVFVGKFVNSFLNNRNISPYKFIYCTLLVAAVPRWYAYYPINMIKYCLVGVVFLFLMQNILNRRAN
jgi:hypothetical protein